MATQFATSDQGGFVANWSSIRRAEQATHAFGRLRQVLQIYARESRSERRQRTIFQALQGTRN